MHRQSSRGQKLDYFILDSATIPWRAFTPKFSPRFFGPFPIIPTGSAKRASNCSTTNHQTKRYKYGGRLDQKISVMKRRLNCDSYRTEERFKRTKRPDGARRKTCFVLERKQIV